MSKRSALRWMQASGIADAIEAGKAFDYAWENSVEATRNQSAIHLRKNDDATYWMYGDYVFVVVPTKDNEGSLRTILANYGDQFKPVKKRTYR